MKINLTNCIYNKPRYINQNTFNTKSFLSQKNTKVSFKGKNLLDLDEKDVFKKIKASLIPENIIGHGTEAEVYRINGTDYCIRVPYETRDLYVMEYNKNVSSAEKVNHTEVKLGYGATIMKYIKGERPKDYIGNKEKRYKLQSDIAKMPLKSYTELLHQIANAIDNEMLFDFSGGNLIVDTEKNKLTAIDFIEITENPRSINPLTEIYSAITSYGSELKTSKKIFDNVIETGLEEFSPKNIPCMDTELFDFVYLCQKRTKEITENKNNTGLIEKITEQVNILKGLKKVKPFDSLIFSFIEEKINNIKSLIKHIK